MEAKEKTQISHQGTIQTIENKIITVRIISKAACASCHAKGACSAADMEEKLIEVEAPQNHNYKVGEVVDVLLNQAAGFKAVLLGYVYPFLLVFITLAIGINFTDDQGFVGLISLSLLLPYYLVLYLTKGMQKKTFSFKIK